MRRTLAGTAVLVAAGLSLLGLARPAAAVFGSAGVTSVTASTATLGTPSSLAVEWMCDAKHSGSLYVATITWTRPSSGRADTFVVETSTDAGSSWSVVATTTGTTATDNGVPRKASRSYRVRVMVGSWTGPTVVVATSAPSAFC